MRILYIDIDSQRPDHLGCYGYHRNTSPTIDQIAKEGIIFDRCYTPDAPCLPSRTAFYSGRFGIQTGVVGHGGTAAQPKIEGSRRGFRDNFDDHGLARQLQHLNYHTAMISPFGQRHAAWHFYAGFNEIHNTGQGGAESAEVVQPVVSKWMADNAAKDNWYLHINYWDPHTPYRVPLNIDNQFADEPLPAWLTDEVIEKNNKKVGPHCAHEIDMYTGNGDPKYPRHPGKATTRESVRQMIDGYDMGVRYVDDQIADIVKDLKAAGVYDDTMIVISADHGENLGEWGLYGEHGTADDITCRVPLIIKYPGGAQGIRNTQFHYNIDFAPTVMDLLGGEKQAIWDGESYATAITEGLDTGRDEVTISQCCHVCQRSVRWGKWLYTRTYHDGFHLFPQEMLHNLEADPHEQNDLAQDNPELCREGQWRLSRWHDAQMQKMALTGNDVVDPLWTVIREGGPFHASLTHGQPGAEGFETYLQYLESSDRQAGADALREKYTPIINQIRA
ncbi:sulfatase [Coraliomargarita sp. SDUM461004]|uniref:Sulfatase n=1 Tax=Thalassobacterium sedimentorum TaxID=3041258 RepID=A0ABU1AFH5_9BACT|nr:sulfatase [Coraliomargarita sp. SDUM461004]MDQ8193515.1 sulfatase [Coraliomargarita sp. SDUM461004]